MGDSMETGRVNGWGNTRVVDERRRKSAEAADRVRGIVRPQRQSKLL